MTTEEIEIQEAEEKRQRLIAERGVTVQDPKSFENTLSAFMHSKPANDAAALEHQEWVRKREEQEREAKKKSLIDRCDWPSRHAERTEFHGKQWHEARAKIDSQLGTGCLLALVGTRGPGKTQLGVCAMRATIERLKSTRFILAMDIFLSIRATFRKDSELSETQAVEAFCKPRLLVIDEIQERGDTAFEDRILTHVINKRYNDKKDTILIGNVTHEAFSSGMNKSIVDRLNETGGIIVCDWPSFRTGWN